MKSNKIYIFAALLGIALVGCQKVEEQATTDNNPIDKNGWKITVKASKEIDTKALALDGTTLKGYWKDGEKVSVYFGGTLLVTLEATVGSPNTSATLSGEIEKPEELGESSSLMLLFPGRLDEKWTYMDQDGSEPTEAGELSTGFDYATASLSVSSIDAGNKKIVTTGDAAFASQQSVYRFGFKVGGAGEAIAVKSFTISSNRNQIVRERTYNGSTWASEVGSLTVTSASDPSGNIYYVSLRNENITLDDTYSFSVVGKDNALYEGSKVIESSNLGNGKFLGAKSLSVSAKVLAPRVETISEEVEVL